jgi:hypothetical protein
MSANASQLQSHLQRLQRLRGKDARPPERLLELKAWQAARLARSYADVAAQPRYAAATSFFLDDLYGAKDFSTRDEEMLRILPTMARILPASAVETATLAIELEALSEDLDQRVAAALPAGPITDEGYARAYRSAATRDERQRQIDLIDAVGRRLDALVAKPLVGTTLKLMRRPARMAGLGDLQDFLERGYGAFSRMGGADDFLALLRQREEALMARITSGVSDPFSA